MGRRYFNSKEKSIIWRKSRGYCGICGYSIDPDEGWDADHIIPWEQGGQTTIKNGQATHIGCNRSKRDRMQKRTRGPNWTRRWGQDIYYPD